MIQWDNLETKSIINLANGVFLVGETVESLKEGNFYYVFPDGTKQYAGVYKNDLKEGLWKDCLWNKLVTSFYIKGVKQPLFGELDQQGRKNGYWIEKYGYNDQLITQGNYQNDVKVGTWSTYFEGLLIGQGDYNEQGVQVGKWMEPLDKYDRASCQLIYKGMYNNGIRNGNWNTYYQGQQYGCGSYDDNGNKIGSWIEVDEKIKDENIIIYQGQYNKNQRTGLWITTYDCKRIGGGLYDNGVKQGQWIDVWVHSGIYPLITYSGDYTNGIRTGKWTLIAENKEIGGGQYDEKGVKQGQWTDLMDEVENTRLQLPYFLYVGEYKDGLPIGQWKIKEYKQSDNLLQSYVGSGVYDEKGLKQGLWTDIFTKDQMKDISLFKGFSFQITFCGEYKNGVRIGKWSALNGRQTVGGGNYTNEGVKQGQWIDLNADYKFQQITYTGEYKNGFRTGEWKGQYPENPVFKSEHVQSCGNYNEHGVKHGQWVDELYDEYFLYSSFRKICGVNLSGEYKNGYRIGDWSIQHGFYNQIKGNCTFDEKERKQGLWTQFYDQIKLSGVYSNDLRTGTWRIVEKNNVIYDGKYAENGVKQGVWIDILEKYIGIPTYSGEYKDGMPIGQWKISCGDQTGIANYDDDGLRQGEWIEVEKNLDIIYKGKSQGKYMKGLKIGEWKTTYTSEAASIVCGGNYDEKGMKQGVWSEFDKCFKQNIEITYQGEYQNGIQRGKWKTLLDGKEIGDGLYDEFGLKQGKWSEIQIELFTPKPKIYEYENGIRIKDLTKKQFEEPQCKTQ